MDHDFYKEKISAYFDGELKDELAVMVAEHLKECQECRMELEKLQQLKEFIEENSELSESEYWEKSAQRIESAIGADEKVKTIVTDIKPVSWKGLGWKLATVAASIALITFIAIYEKDMSDEMYELTEPDSILLNQPTTTDATSNQFENREVQEKPSETLEEFENKSIPEVNGYTEISKEEKIDQVKLRGVITEEINLKSQTPSLLVAEEAPEKDDTNSEVAGSDKIQVISNRIKESEKQLSAEQTQELATDELKLTDESGKPITLTGWQNKRDEILSSLNKIDRLEIKQSYAKSKTSNRASSASIQPDQVLVLLECYYNIAILTSDALEYNKSVEEIKKYSVSKNEEYKKQAGYYIEKLSEKGDKR